MSRNIRHQSLPSYFNGSRRLGEAVEWMGTFNSNNWFNPYSKALSEERSQLLDMNQIDSYSPQEKHLP